MSLPKTHKVLVLFSLTTPVDLKVHEAPTPAASSGSAVVKVLSTYMSPNAKVLFSGALGYPMKVPFTPGTGCIGRVAALGADATTLQPGQLVFVHPHIRARDSPEASMVHGAFAIGPAEKLMDDEWRQGSWAEYVKVPLENVFALDEDVLIKQMGYSIHDLPPLTTLLIPMGGLVDMNLKAGQSIIVAPATGFCGGAAVIAALAMGAKVVATGRNEGRLKAMVDTFGPVYGGRLTSVKFTGSVEADTAALQKASPGGKGFDAFIDFSPHEAAESTHIKSCLMALKTAGQASFMGGVRADVKIPYFLLVLKSIQIKGKLMYDRAETLQLLGMVEAGLLKLGKAGGMEAVGTYKFEDVAAAMDAAAQNTGFGNGVTMAP